MPFHTDTFEPPLILGVVILTAVLLIFFSRRQFNSNLPPGPALESHSIGGRLPAKEPWKLLSRWNKTYGPVTSFRLGSQVVVVIGSVKCARDLFSKKGRIYSGRPRSIVANEILSPLRGLGMSDGPQYRKWKTFMQAGLGPSVVPKYQELQSRESFLLLKELIELKDPLEFRSRIQRFAASIIFSVSYGRRILSLQEDVVLKHAITTKYFLQASTPGKYLVDSWPILLYLPRFMQWFRWGPERQRSFDTDFFLSLMNEVRDKMKADTARPSMAMYGLEKQEEFGLTDEEAAYTLSAPWAAGVETTTNTIVIFLMAMLRFPDVMKKAQQEIDAVIGHDRMPNFSDMEALPYIQALIKEVTRWRCLVPLGIAHAATENDVYEDMLIPKGSTVYGNIHKMTRDEDMFPDPDEFRPERFLNTSDPMLLNFTTPFGFGRRQCPGMSVALQTIFITVARILWAFEIYAPPDDKGNPVLPTDEFTGGLVVSPVPFKCLFQPRFSSASELVLQEAEKAQAELTAGAE